MDPLIQLILSIAGNVSNMFTTWRGFKAVEAKLVGYIKVDDYRAKVSELHGEINTLKIENAGLKRDVAHLLERGK